METQCKLDFSVQGFPEHKVVFIQIASLCVQTHVFQEFLPLFPLSQDLFDVLHQV